MTLNKKCIASIKINFFFFFTKVDNGVIAQTIYSCMKIKCKHFQKYKVSEVSLRDLLLQAEKNIVQNGKRKKKKAIPYVDYNFPILF